MIIFDVESNGLLDDATKIHCLSYIDTDRDKDIITLYDYDDMRLLFSVKKHFACHNIIRYDIPLLEKLLDIKIERDIENEDDVVQNTTNFIVDKNRPFAKLGKAGSVYYDPKTTLIRESYGDEEDKMVA